MELQHQQLLDIIMLHTAVSPCSRGLWPGERSCLSIRVLRILQHQFLLRGKLLVDRTAQVREVCYKAIVMVEARQPMSEFLD